MTNFYYCWSVKHRSCGFAHRGKSAAGRCHRDFNEPRSEILTIDAPRQVDARDIIERTLTNADVVKRNIELRTSRRDPKSKGGRVGRKPGVGITTPPVAVVPGSVKDESPPKEEPTFKKTSDIQVFTNQGALALEMFAAEVRKAGSLDMTKALDEFKAHIETFMYTFKDATSPQKLKDMVAEFLAKRGTREIVIKTPPSKKSKNVGRQHPLFERLARYIAARQRVWIYGPTASGKTTACEVASDALSMPLFIQPPVDSKYELTGFHDAKGKFHDTPLYRWAKSKDGGLLVLDEIDASHPRALTGINAATGNGWCIFPDEQIKLGNKHFVIATANTTGFGATIEYVGRSKQDLATVNRFPRRLFWDYDEHFEADLSMEHHGGSMVMVRACQRIRANLREEGVQMTWSPRDTFSYCDCRAMGMSHREALEDSALAVITEDQRKKVLEGVERIAGTSTVNATL